MQCSALVRDKRNLHLLLVLKMELSIYFAFYGQLPNQFYSSQSIFGQMTSAIHDSNRMPSRSSLVQVRYDERGSREEEWLKLGRSRFSWLSEPTAGCPSNPTEVQGLTPTGKDAVDHKVTLAYLIAALDCLSAVSACRRELDCKAGPVTHLREELRCPAEAEDGLSHAPCRYAKLSVMLSAHPAGCHLMVSDIAFALWGVAGRCIHIAVRP